MELTTISKLGTRASYLVLTIYTTLQWSQGFSDFMSSLILAPFKVLYYLHKSDPILSAKHLLIFNVWFSAYIVSKIIHVMKKLLKGRFDDANQ